MRPSSPEGAFSARFLPLLGLGFSAAAHTVRGRPCATRVFVLGVDGHVPTHARRRPSVCNAMFRCSDVPMFRARVYARGRRICAMSMKRNEMPSAAESLDPRCLSEMRQSINAECGSGWGAGRERSGTRSPSLPRAGVWEIASTRGHSTVCSIHPLCSRRRAFSRERASRCTPGGSYWFETRQFRHHHGRERDHTWWSWCRGRTSSEEREWETERETETDPDPDTNTDTDTDTERERA